jgi:hypothetical protein
VKTTDGLASWPAFVEACERRNLFAHSNGLVSEQYRIKCLAVGAPCPHNKGEKLDVTPAYLRKTIGIFLEIGIKIAQVISRKLDKSRDNIINMDGTINSISYDLISHEHYAEASELLDFAVFTMKQHPDAEILNMMIVNNANAHKLSGDIENSKKILSEVDWSPFDSKYKISVAAVLDDIDRVIALMPQMKNRDDFDAASYQDWPVFTSIRTNDKFLRAYEELYGRPFTVGTVKHQDTVNAQDALDQQEMPQEAVPEVKH